MDNQKFDDLCHDVRFSLSYSQTEALRDLLEQDAEGITLEINCGRRPHELNAADELAETLERVGVAESLDILKSWEGGQRG
jgi:hypothetical protein